MKNYFNLNFQMIEYFSSINWVQLTFIFPPVILLFTVHKLINLRDFPKSR
jgi:hypothetical protein